MLVSCQEKILKNSSRAYNETNRSIFIMFRIGEKNRTVFLLPVATRAVK